MNIQYLKYALVIAKTGSINKAAEKLLIAQPNLSRAIKELEKELGISIFERSLLNPSYVGLRAITFTSLKSIAL